MGPMGHWVWGEPRNMSQEWVDTYSKGLVGQFHVDGVMFALTTTVDEGNDGIPDMKWTKGDIMSWMDENSVEYSALNTKAKLIAKVTEYLNPTEDSMSNGDMDNTAGDE